MKQSVKRMVSTIVALAALTAATVLFFNFIVPLYRDIAVIRGEQASRESLLANQKRIVAQVKALASSYEEASRLRDIVSSALPLTPGVAEALLQLNGLAGINNLKATAFVLSPTPAAQPSLRDEARKTAFLKTVGSVTIRTDMTGSYEDFKSFLKNLETNIRIFDVTAISVQPLLKPSQNEYRYAITVVAYYQNP